MVKKNTTATVRKKVAPDGDSTSPRSTRIPRDPTPSSPSFATPGENHRLHLEAVQTTALTGAATTNVHGIVAWLMNQPDCRIVSLYQHVGALCSPFHQERLVYYAFLDPHGRPTSTVHEVADAVASMVFNLAIHHDATPTAFLIEARCRTSIAYLRVAPDMSERRRRG